MTMTAICCTEPGSLSEITMPRPVRQPGQVLLRMKRIGICGTDYHIFSGLQPFLQYPRVMGHELSAVVAEADASTGFKAGQLVVVNPYLSCGTCHACKNGKPNCCMQIQVLGIHRDGGMCEWMCLPAGNLIPADGLSEDEAASVEYLAIGAHAVRRAQILGGMRVLVIGAGPIGLGAALFARFAGCEVILMDREADRLDLAGNATGIRALLKAGAGASDYIAKATGNNGFHVVFDATGNRASMENGFSYVAHGGIYVLVGLVKDNITFSDPDFHKKEMTLMASRNATTQDFEKVMTAMKTRQIVAARLITHRTRLAETVRELPRLAQEKKGLIKAVIEID